VSERTWLIEKCLELLSNDKNYIKYNIHFPRYTLDQADLLDSLLELCASVVDANSLNQLVPDIRKLDFLHRQMIVSRKHTHNLFDLTNLWKNIV
jgi:transcription initiation factor IIE alpha subunit